MLFLKSFPHVGFTEDSRSPHFTQCFRKTNELINNLMEITQNFRGEMHPPPHLRHAFGTLPSGDGGRDKPTRTFSPAPLFSFTLEDTWNCSLTRASLQEAVQHRNYRASLPALAPTARDPGQAA